MTQLMFDNIGNTILTKVTWTHHLVLMSRTKIDEEREFYLQLCVKEKYTVKELDRQISSGLFKNYKSYSVNNFSKKEPISFSLVGWLPDFHFDTALVPLHFAPIGEKPNR